MYKFLMVDDEEIVRRGFRRKIDWQSLDFEFLDPAENGERAIEAIEILRPDVVMTDIFMPRVDGLQVAEYAADHHPEIIMVILSGYDEFEYARKAMRSNVFEYVLKPVTSRDLLGLLGRVKARLDMSSAERRETSALRERADIANTLMRERRLLDLVSGSANGQAISELLGLLAFPTEGLSCAAIVAEDYGDSRVSSLVASAAQSARHALAFPAGERRSAILVFEQGTAACERITAALAARIAAAAGAACNVGFGEPGSELSDAPASFAEAVAALSSRLIAGPGAAFRYQQAGPNDPALVADLKSKARHLCQAVVSGEADEALEQAGTFFALLREACFSPQRIRHEVDALFELVLDSLRELGISAAVVSEDLGIDYDLAVQRLRTSEEVKAHLAKVARYAGSVLESRNLPVPQWKVKDFEEYVARHFGEPNLTVEKIAHGLTISASYLSKLVRRHTERSVVDYLIDYRMERAKELLATTDLMTYEIAEATGYTDARYFSSTFRRRIGLTPTEFRGGARSKTARS